MKRHHKKPQRESASYANQILPDAHPIIGGEHGGSIENSKIPAEQRTLKRATYHDWREEDVSGVAVPRKRADREGRSLIGGTGNRPISTANNKLV